MAFGTSAELVFDVFARDNASDTFRRIGGASSSASSNLTKFSGKLKTIAKVGALAAAAAGIYAAKWGIEAVKAGAEDQQQQALLANAIRHNTDARKKDIDGLEDWIGKMGTAYGVADDDLRPALQRLVTSTKDVGKAQKLASLAMDVSAGTGKSLESVSSALMKAQNGQVSGLSRLGVKTKNAAGETMSLEQITKQLADTYGGSAATKADTFQGKMDRLKLIFSETKEAVGAKLLPILSDLASWFLDKGIPAISSAHSWLADKLGPVFATVGDIIKNRLWPFIQGVGESIGEDLPGFVDQAKAAFKDARPWFEAVGTVFSKVIGPAVKWLAENILPALGLAIRAVGKFWQAEGKVFKWVWGNLIKPAFDAFAKAIKAIGKVGTWLWNSIFQPVFKFIAKAIAKVIELFANMLHTLGNVPGGMLDWAEKAADKRDKAAK